MFLIDMFWLLWSVKILKMVRSFFFFSVACDSTHSYLYMNN